MPKTAVYRSAESEWPNRVKSLLRPAAYPHPVSAIEVEETHISWVFLTGDIAYKVKKPVDLGFVDFSTLARRRYFCHQELRLNRRWAPQIYLSVVSICGTPELPRVGGEGKPIEFAVQMRQFPKVARLDRQLSLGLLDAPAIGQLAVNIAHCHSEARRIGVAETDAAFDRIRQPMLENFVRLRPHWEANDIDRIATWTRQRLQALKSTLIQRQQDGSVRECHGDLHLENLVRLPTGIAAFDCIEFDAELRNIDVCSDIAFLTMDLSVRGRVDLAYAFLNRYLERCGDYMAIQVYGLYFVYHCMIRAKVAAIRFESKSSDCGRDLCEISDYCGTALSWMDRAPPILIAMHGLSGSGKTWLSQQLLAILPAIRVRSDIERKRIYHVDELATGNASPGSGIYDRLSESRTYDRLLDLAGTILASGLNVILDATFIRRDKQERVVELGKSLNVPWVFVDVFAEKRVLMRRIVRRQLGGRDASQAGLSVLQHQFATADPLDAARCGPVVRINSGSEIDIDSVANQIRSARGIMTNSRG